MYPYSYTGLRLIHDEKVRDAMERASIDLDLARSSQRTAGQPLPGRLLSRVRSKLNVFARPSSRIISSRSR